MALGSARASTQDSSAGTPVACSVNEDDATKNLQATVAVGNKTTWSETSRTGISGADAPTGGDMTTTGFAGSAGANLADSGNALGIALRATCSLASKTLTGRVALYDSSNACIGVSETISFTSDATLRLGNAAGDFIARANQMIDAGGSRKFRFFVDTVSGGTWAIYLRPC